MKKTRMISLMALLLVGLMLFSSCGAAGTIKLKSCLDGSLYVDQNPPYAAATAIADLKDAYLESDYGDLMLFWTEVEVDGEEYDKYIVYNAKSGTVVFTVTDTETVENYVHLDALRMDMSSEFAFFYVETTTYTKEDDIVNYDKYTVSMVLYNADGTQIATAAREAYYECSYDLIYFDGKVYRLGEDGKFAYAFDFSPLAYFPYIDYATEDMYISIGGSEPAALGLFDGGDQLDFYDKELNLLASYAMPSYISHSSFVLLENGDLLVQVAYEQEEYSEDYDFYDDGDKMLVDTYLLDTKKATMEPVECAYVIEFSVPLTDDMRAMAGFNDKLANLALVCPIVNKRIDTNNGGMASFKNNGEIELLEQINGMTIVEMQPIATNLWYVYTAGGFCYLINEKGDILGDISNADYKGGYFEADGKLYDYNFELVLDYEAEGLEIYEYYEHSILFENKEGELILFANGTKTTLIAKDAEREFIDYYSNYDYFVICDATNLDAIKYEVYNDAGTKILTLDNDVEYFEIEPVSTSCDGVRLIRVITWDLEKLDTVYNYYRLG